MCLSGFDRLDLLIQKPVYSETRSTPSGVRGIVHLSQGVFNVEDKQGLGPNLCVGICYSLDV